MVSLVVVMVTVQCLGACFLLSPAVASWAVPWRIPWKLPALATARAARGTGTGTGWLGRSLHVFLVVASVEESAVNEPPAIGVVPVNNRRVTTEKYILFDS